MYLAAQRLLILIIQGIRASTHCSRVDGHRMALSRDVDVKDDTKCTPRSLLRRLKLRALQDPNSYVTACQVPVSQETSKEVDDSELLSRGSCLHTPVSLPAAVATWALATRPGLCSLRRHPCPPETPQKQQLPPPRLPPTAPCERERQSDAAVWAEKEQQQQQQQQQWLAVQAMGGRIPVHLTSVWRQRKEMAWRGAL